jgi:protein-disulfide isomerase
MAKKTTKEKASPNIIQSVLVLLLIVAAFFIGYLWNKVQTMEGMAYGAGNAGNGSKEAAPTPEVPQAKTIEDVLAEIDIDREKVEECISSKETAEVVNAHFKSGVDAGVGGTPNNFVIDTQTGQTVYIPGAISDAQLGSLVDRMLSGEDVSEGEVSVEGITDNDHVRGKKDARIVFVEYSDYDCPVCTRFHPWTLKFFEQYQDKVAWVYRHFPLDNMHPNARAKAEAAECVANIGGNDAFWAYTDAMLK